MTAWLWAAVALLGGAGAIARFGVDKAVTFRAGGGFPLGTLAVNLSGSFALGVLIGVGAGGNLYLLAGTATLGSYTTFSTWVFETHRLAEDGQLMLAVLNGLLSLLLGFGAALIGRTIGLAL